MAEDIRVNVSADTSGAISALQNLKKTLSEVGQKVEELGGSKFEKFNKGLSDVGNKMKDFGKKYTALITLPIVAAGASFVKASSDYQETLSKSSVVFGKNAKDVQGWAGNLVESFGLSKSHALEMASGFGSLAKGMGITETAGAEMAKNLTQMTGDMASYFNSDLGTAGEALNAIFTNQTEPLLKFGVVMNETELKAYGLAKGLQKPYDQMSAGEKVQLRYQYVMEKLSQAHGDFARTNQGTANSMRIFQERLNDLQVTLGEKILPLFTPFVQKANEILLAFTNLDPHMQTFILAFAGILAILPPLVFIIGALATTIGFLLSPIGLVGLGIAGLIAIGVLLWKNWDFIRAKAVEVWGGIKAKFEEFKNWLGNVFTTDWSTRFGRMGDILNGFLRNVSNIFGGVKQIFSGIIQFVTGVFTGNWSQAWSGVISIFKGIFNTLGAVAKAPLNGLISLVNSAISSLNKFNMKVPDGVPLIGGKNFSLNIPKIPYLAKGGLATDATTAVIGEGKYNEAVLPLSNTVFSELAKGITANMPDNIGGVGDTYGDIYINVNGTVREEADIDKISKKLMSDIKRDRRGKGKR